MVDEEGGLNIDWDRLLDDIPDDPNLDFCDVPVAGGLSASTDTAFSLSITDIEQYLMEDDDSNIPEEIDRDILAGEFFSDVLLDSSPGSGFGSDHSKDSSATPESAVENETEGEEKEKESCVNALLQTKESSAVVIDADEDDDDDPLAENRKRKIRNRDAAVRSRERKKMYVRDLEMKSKYYEAECKRLGFVLQCCLAENQALRLSMFSNNTSRSSKASDVSMTEQESAVLFLESLLLGSLLGCLGIVYLLILPILEASLLENEGSGEWENLVSPRREENKVRRVVFHSFMLGKRCRSSRSRMKLRFLTAFCISGNLNSRSSSLSCTTKINW